MRLPNANAAYQHRVRFGRYTARQLKQAGLTALYTYVDAATQDVKTKGRAWEDAEESIQDALADRDAIDNQLDTTAQTIRLALASRALDAARTSPYTDIFPDGIEYYTASPLPENPKRYGELSTRIEKFLPESDSLRAESVKKLKELIALFEEALKAVANARTQQSIASSALDSAEELWARQIERTYGALIESQGKTKAERVFPSIRTNRATEETNPE